jgi:uncharacterized membrane protein YvbJ
MKQCPSCGSDVHDLAKACPECGGKWDEAGRFTPLADADDVHARLEEPKSVGEMTPEQLRSAIVGSSFLGALMAGGVLILLLWLLGLMLAGD